MYVSKRNGTTEPMAFDKITRRVNKLVEEFSVDHVDTIRITQNVVSGLYPGVSTSEIDSLAAETCVSLITVHPNYGRVGALIAMSNHHKMTNPSFVETMESIKCIDPTLLSLMRKYKDTLDAMVLHVNDYQYDYFGFRTLYRSYLLKKNGVPIERPQYVLMRVACALHLPAEDMDALRETYEALSSLQYTHATPTLFNSCTSKGQLASCFLMCTHEDSIEGIFDTVKDCALISKHAGGIGLSIHSIRSKGSPIHGTNGTSNGIVPMIKVFESTARYVDQCFTPSTRIFTSQGIVQIQHLVAGEHKVLTNSGSFQVVEQVRSYPCDARTYAITTQHCIEPVVMTALHPVLAVRYPKEDPNLLLGALDARLVDVEYLDDLQVGDWLATPIPTPTVLDIEAFALEDASVYGLMCACANGTQLKGSIGSLYRIREYLMNRGIEVVVDVEGETGTLETKGVSTEGILPFTFEEVLQGIPNRFMTLPLSKVRALTNGFFTRPTYTTYIPDLLYSIAYLYLRQGKLLTVERTTFESTRGEVVKYVAHEARPQFIQYRNYLLSRIVSVNDEEYTGTVYDLNISTEHNYTCASLGLAKNGGGKRKGSFAMYIEPWHADIMDFLRLKRNQGKEELRARDLFYALWVPDLFMKRVEENGTWSLFDPASIPVDLSSLWGKAFEEAYEALEREGKFETQLPARDVFQVMIESQVETGTPYVLFKDRCNACSNHANLGTIKSSNLCCEILEYTDPDTIAVCNLASVNLSQCVVGNAFDYDRLRRVVDLVVRNMNKVIDNTYYILDSTHKSNMSTRPMGVGVQGLADVFMKLRIPYTEARDLNRRIFEVMYHQALYTSCELAREQGAYPAFEGSPLSKGKFHFELYGYGSAGAKPNTGTLTCDWEDLRKRITEYGVRNSLLIALMPTATTAQIIGNFESFEPISSNLFTRSVLAGQYVVLNKYLVDDLMRLGIWNEDTKNSIVQNSGSVQHLDIPDKEIYKTVWEIPQRALMEMSADRGAFVDQSQSHNVYFENPIQKLYSYLLGAWKAGLKTGMYYLRTRAAADAVKFTIQPSRKSTQSPPPPQACDISCMSCSA